MFCAFELRAFPDGTFAQAGTEWIHLTTPPHTADGFPVRRSEHGYEIERGTIRAPLQPPDDLGKRLDDLW